MFGMFDNEDIDYRPQPWEYPSMTETIPYLKEKIKNLEIAQQVLFQKYTIEYPSAFKNILERRQKLSSNLEVVAERIKQAHQEINNESMAPANREAAANQLMQLDSERTTLLSQFKTLEKCIKCLMNYSQELYSRMSIVKDKISTTRLLLREKERAVEELVSLGLINIL